ncbi:hypothetical protein COLO4_04967 [Corchorus olitorius]|uniref:Uncharacterized protein n=1 Tax=Corchorus olitorius TaxID=93759 RepID=A0A1R3KS87_9ROSI|nr:hypothetical protein COLO4_04967 [Corchorus olitorius]
MGTFGLSLYLRKRSKTRTLNIFADLFPPPLDPSDLTVVERLRMAKDKDQKPLAKVDELALLTGSRDHLGRFRP